MCVRDNFRHCMREYARRTSRWSFEQIEEEAVETMGKIVVFLFHSYFSLVIISDGESNN